MIDMALVVPGASEYGMQPGSKCVYCDKLAVSICNFRYGNFIGCGKTFCREHGITHYSPLMLDQVYLESLNNDMLDDDTKKMANSAMADRSSAKNGI